jgi:cytochrome c553
VTRWIAKIVVLTGVVLFSSILYAEADLSNGKAVYKQECATCHGDYGEVSNAVIPNILGQYPAYLLTQMAAFLADDPRESRRGVAGNLKRSILSGLTVEDVQDVIAYLGTIKYKIVGASKEEAGSRGELAANGWWLANFAGCGNCHGDDFQGLRVRNPGTGELDPGVGAPMTPKLVGLKYEYLVRQLRAYQSGDRAGGLSAMKHIMAPLFQTPRMMQAIGVYAEGVSIVPVTGAESGAQQ